MKLLWELWLVEGVDDGFVLISKIYYAFVDGIFGVDIVTVLFDFDFVLVLVDLLLCWLLRLLLICVMLFVDVVVECVEGPFELVCEVIVYLDRAGADVGRVVVGLVALLVVGVEGAPVSLINVCIGLYWCFVWVDIDFVLLKVIKDVYGVTVNDVVLVIVVGVLRVYLFCYCCDFEGMELKVMVLILVRVDVECGVFGNCVVVMYVLLFVGVVNLVERLHFVHVAMVGLKESG